MRRVVVSDDYRELEIWPSESFDRYLEITEEEVKRLLIDKGNLVDVPCPACESNRKRKGFNKFGLEYVECMDCKTLYIFPRPSEESINRYFKESEAIKFWHSHVVKETLKGRISHLFRPRSTWVANLTEQYIENPAVFVDINTMYVEFLEQIDKLNLFKNKIVLDPVINLAESIKGEKGFEVINTSIMNVDSNEFNANVVTAFAIIDRVFNPEKILKAAKSLLNDSGLLFLTTSTIGFDLQVLWNNSKTIFPPDKINLLSVEGIVKLLDKCGFEIIELSTPGQLDVELVKNAMENNEDLQIPRFIAYFLKNRDKDAHRSFQEFLQQFKLSSHVRVVARRK